MKMNFFIWSLYFVTYLSLCSAWWSWSWSWPWPWSWSMFRSEGCKLRLKKDLSQANEPIFLVKGPKGYELAMPQLIENDGAFKLKKGEKLIVACPGRYNEVRGISKIGIQSTVSTCVSGNTLNTQNLNVLSSTLDCKKRAYAMLKLTRKECGGYIGEEVELGFEVAGWHNLVTTCYYRSQGEALYSKHMLYGTTLKGAEVKHRQGNYLRGPKKMFPNFNPQHAYKQANQRLMLTRLLGENKANYMLSRTYLSRGHLAPYADFLMGSWQHLTYYYVNVAPQWQSINGGSWMEMEKNLRHFAINVKADLAIYTGTYEILTLKDEYGNDQPLYLESYLKLLPVPKYFWKLVVYPEKKSCIVFLVYNNPFVESAPPTICPNICENHGWPTNLNDNFRGHVFCCNYQDFKKVVDYIPDETCSTVTDNEYLYNIIN